MASFNTLGQFKGAKMLPTKPAGYRVTGGAGVGAATSAGVPRLTGTHMHPTTIGVTGKGSGVTGGPMAVPGATPTAAAPASAAPASTAATDPTASPYDAQYYIDLASATNKANQQIGTYNSDIANGQTNLSNSLAQLAHNQALKTTQDQQAENARGGFAQGALGQTLGEVARQYQDTGSGYAQKYAQDTAAWNSAIAGVRQGLSTDTIALQLASAQRAARIPAAGPDPATATAPAAPSSGDSGTGPSGGTSTAAGGSGLPSLSPGPGISDPLRGGRGGGPRVLKTAPERRSSRKG